MRKKRKVYRCPSCLGELGPPEQDNGRIHAYLYTVSGRPAWELEASLWPWYYAQWETCDADYTAEYISST